MVADHAIDANSVSLRYSKLWIGALNRTEREDFYTAVERVAAAEGAVTDTQRAALVKLRERLTLLN